MISQEITATIVRRPKLARALHILMIALCLVASIALYLVDNYTYKVVISLIMIAYTIFLLINSHIIRLILNIHNQQINKVYDQKHQWNVSVPISDSKCQTTYNKQTEESHSKTKFDGDRADLMNTSSIDRSFQGRDISMSAYRAVNSSDIYQSRIGSHKRIQTRESVGLDLDDLSFQSSHLSEKSIVKSKIGSQKLMVITDRKSMARNSSMKDREHNEKNYETQLKTKFNKNNKTIQSRYKFILSNIQRLISPMLTEDKYSNEKLKQICSQFLDVTIYQQKTDHWKYQIVNLQQKIKGKQIRLSFQYCVFQFYLLMNGRIDIDNFKIPFKANKTIRDLQRRLMDIIKTRVQLGQRMGIEPILFQNKYIKSTVEFIDQYNRYIEMISQYIASQLNSSDKSDKYFDGDDTFDGMDKDYKNKIYILYLFINQINRNIGTNNNKIKFNHFMDFPKQPLSSYELQVYPTTIYDSFSPHFNIYRRKDNDRSIQLHCQSGENNYLSVIYCLVHCLSLNSQLMGLNTYAYQLVHQIL